MEEWKNCQVFFNCETEDKKHIKMIRIFTKLLYFQVASELFTNMDILDIAQPWLS